MGEQAALRDLSEGCPPEAAGALRHPGPTSGKHWFGRETMQQG